MFQSVNKTLVSATLVLALVIGGSYALFHWRRVERYQKPAPAPAAINQPGLTFKKAPAATLLFVGDVMLDRNIGLISEKAGDWRYPFLKTAGFLKAADLTIANLEGPLSDQGTKAGSIYSFRADPRMLAGLTYAGFDVLTLANNHIWDYGREAMLDTMKRLERAGIAYVGGGPDFASAHRPVVKNVRGTRVAFLGYTDLIPPALASAEARPAVAFLDKEQVRADIERARDLADLVVVALHWGEEYQTRPSRRQTALGRALIEAGADLIVGHHPHVIQAGERYLNGYIAYSLGNFVFDQNFSQETAVGLILKVTVRGREITRVEPLPVRFTDSFQPFLAAD